MHILYYFYVTSRLNFTKYSFCEIMYMKGWVKMNFDKAPILVKQYLTYLSVVNAKSPKTVYEYYLDLCSFLKFLKKNKLAIKDDVVEINDIDLDFIKSITLQDAYEYLYYLSDTKKISPATRNRKMCSVRGFFKYLSNKAGILENNPMQNLESASIPHKLPKYLSLDECNELLENVDGKNSKRDYAALVLFLNCGLRLSELVSIDIVDVQGDFLTITGKGNKQRNLYLNEACKNAIKDYILNEREISNLKDDSARRALFVSQKGTRMTPRAVQYVVEKRLKQAGLSEKNYSTHKLRHTAATLMHKHGGVDIRVLQDILGHENLGTTQIYTHIDSEQIQKAVESNPLSKVKNNKKKTSSD